MQSPALQIELQEQPIVEAGDSVRPVPNKTMAAFQTVLATRNQALEEIRPFVSGKFFELLQNKLAVEQTWAEDLTSTASSRLEHKQKYTHVLDSQYFEQRFL